MSAVEKVSSACNRNRLRREYLQTTRRGGLTCPPVTRCAYTIYTFIHPIYGNQNQMAQVIGFVRCCTFSTVVSAQLQCWYIPLLWRGGRRSLTGWSCRGIVEKVSSACNRNRLRREYLQTTRRGGLTCPPVTRCAYTIYTFIHSIYGNQNQMAQVIGFVRCRTFSTAPSCLHNFSTISL